MIRSCITQLLPSQPAVISFYLYPRLFRTTLGSEALPDAGLVEVCFFPCSGFAAASFCVAGFAAAALGA